MEAKSLIIAKKISGFGYGSAFPCRHSHQNQAKSVLRTSSRYYGSEALRCNAPIGELPYAALQLAPRNLDDIPPLADTTTGPGEPPAALRAQVEHEDKLKQESKEALVRDYSNRIAPLLTSSMRPKAGLKLLKLQATHALLLYPSMYDGVQNDV
eukprot:2516445-Pleurochrysis_carterae.AAC.1